MSVLIHKNIPIYLGGLNHFVTAKPLLRGLCCEQLIGISKPYPKGRRANSVAPTKNTNQRKTKYNWNASMWNVFSAKRLFYCYKQIDQG